MYLQGIPYFLPREQLDVPMFWWLPAASASRLGVDTACVRARSSQPASHDNLYHSLLGLMDVRTPSYRAGRDLFAGCRGRDSA